MEKLFEILLCSGVSIGVFVIPIILFFIIDFTIWNFTGKSLYHLFMKLFKKEIK